MNIHSNTTTQPQPPWKAMILAAGLGTRLRPYTEYTPKAMFPIGGRPIIDRTIQLLIEAGCSGVLINTHHLHHRIEAFIAAQEYPIPVRTRYEPEILGTGGGINNAADFFENHPFVVLNSDILTDIPLADVYAYHCRHSDPVTMVLCDDPRFNTVRVDGNGRVLGFGLPAENAPTGNHRPLTFTGIQVLDPDVLDHIPEVGFSSSIDAYQRILNNGRSIQAYLATGHQWRDIGTPESYRETIFHELATKAFDLLSGAPTKNRIQSEALAGDGSDRRWFRLTSGGRTLIMADHGICEGRGPLEVDAFIDIGRHLHRQNVAVPELIAWERHAGLVFMEDLGDTNLQSLFREAANSSQIVTYYQHVIRAWAQLATKGHEGFDPDWTYPSRRYDEELIIEKECRYFVDAFLKGYLGMEEDCADCRSEFEYLAAQIMAYAIDGLIHRDFQSRNIMEKGDQFYFIDFQGARTGPVQYDLASLLIDPYVDLSTELRESFLNYAFDVFSGIKSIDRGRFFAGYRYCALSRNLQILGAFGFLSRVKMKPQFASYIPGALVTLIQQLDHFSGDQFQHLKQIAAHAAELNEKRDDS